MKLLVLSHPCVTPINQSFFAEVEDQTGWSITIVTPKKWETEYGLRSSEQWPEFDGDLLRIPVFGSGNVPLHIYRSTFRSLLRRLKPDAIYVHNEAYAASTAQMWLANRTTINAPIGFYSAQNLVKQYPPPFRWTEQMVYRSAKFAFPCSKSALETLRTKGYEGPATWLPLSIDEDLYQPHPNGPSLRNELAKGADVLFGYVGRLSPEKGLLTLLDALHQLPESLNWRLVVVGSGPTEALFRTRAERLDLTSQITHLGFVDHPEVPQYYSEFDLLVLPSETMPTIKEQFGRVILEALACGTPVVGSTSGEIPNLIEKTGGGITFQEKNAGALADALTTLSKDPARRNQLTKKGRRTVLTEFTNEALATKFSDAIAHAVSSPHQVSP